MTAKDGRLAEYVSIVENTTLPEEYSDLSPDEMKELSREILYDSFYNDFQNYDNVAYRTLSSGS